MAKYARITGWGKYVPERVLTNFDLEKMVDTSDEWIRTRTGIRERRIAGPGETCSTMSLAAARRALAVAQLLPSDVDLVLVATSTPDYLVPSVASMVQDQLGATRAAAFSLQAGCTGWVVALVTASQFIQTGGYRNALVIGTEHLSMGVDWTDRNTCVLFGDGSGAVVLEASDLPTGLLSFELGSDGSEYDALIYPLCRRPPTQPRGDRSAASLPAHGWPAGLQVCHPGPGRFRGQGGHGGRANRGGDRPDHPPPGQRPDPGDGAPPIEASPRKDDGQRGPVRQHVGRLGADCAGGGD